MYHISEIELASESFKPYNVVSTGRRWKPISQINLLVGANNSGKSRFLRALAAMKPLRFAPNCDLEPLRNIVRQLHQGVIEACRSYNVDDANQLVVKTRDLETQLDLIEGSTSLDEVRQVFNALKNNENLITVKGQRSDHSDHHVLRQRFQQIALSHETALNEILGKLLQKYDFKRIYIPTLRGLRRFGPGDVYKDRTMQDYFQNVKDIDVFTGLSLYDDLSQLLLGDTQERRIAADFEQFLSDSFFDGEIVTLIPKYKQDVIDVKIGHEKQLPIFQLGDGIQSIIILTFPLFLHRRENVLIFMEEPELFLHPGMQRLLINAFQRPDFSTAQYFLATHSNHLLDLSLDVDNISVFTFSKVLESTEHLEREAKIDIENVSNEDERSLQLLGILNSSVFLANCTIWVEGVTDRRYFSHYLDLYQVSLATESELKGQTPSPTFKQDLHYSFVEYAGSNITHYSWLNEANPIVVERLCGRLFLICDRDDATKASRIKRHEILTDKLKDRYYRLNCRETENLLTPSIIQSVLYDTEGGNAKLTHFVQSDYKSKPLGRFIDERILQLPAKKYAAESGTIDGKVKFCQCALSHIKSFADLSEEAKELAKRIYKFIADQNSR
jgi:predicted ATP-dependent endonuclease of OLD family